VLVKIDLLVIGSDRTDRLLRRSAFGGWRTDRTLPHW